MEYFINYGGDSDTDSDTDDSDIYFISDDSSDSEDDYGGGGQEELDAKTAERIKAQNNFNNSMKEQLVLEKDIKRHTDQYKGSTPPEYDKILSEKQKILDVLVKDKRPNLYNLLEAANAAEEQELLEVNESNIRSPSPPSPDMGDKIYRRPPRKLTPLTKNLNPEPEQEQEPKPTNHLYNEFLPQKDDIDEGEDDEGEDDEGEDDEGEDEDEVDLSPGLESQESYDSYDNYELPGPQSGESDENRVEDYQPEIKKYIDYYKELNTKLKYLYNITDTDIKDTNIPDINNLISITEDIKYLVEIDNNNAKQLLYGNLLKEIKKLIV